MDRIIVEDPNPNWPLAFEREKAALEAALSSCGIVAIHHIGGTAVPGLPAKPVIDVLIEVADMSVARAQFPPLMEELGYDFWRDNPKLDRLFFVKGRPPKGSGRTHHVHVGRIGGELSSRLAFRDFLIQHEDWRNRYAALKIELAKKHADDREAYTNAKGAFIAEVMELVAAQ